MDRKEFLKKGIIGSGAAIALGAIASSAAETKTDSYPPQVGANHIPNKETIMKENMLIHRNETRGHADHGWLNARHSFSFANYYNPDRMNFGVLRVLNDDIVAPGRGFSTHPHDNMEIITIPLSGDLEHKDSMGNGTVIKQNDVQVMSAGTGIYHSEFNHNSDKEVRLLQIWVFPNKRNVEPRYDQITLPVANRNVMQQILSPNPNDEGVWIHQDAWFHMGYLDKGFKGQYTIKKEGNGVYAFVIEGSISLGDEVLNRRDAGGIWNTSSFAFEASEDSQLLLLEVPMKM
jgi:quercetin 2,3-dioxygenase